MAKTKKEEPKVRITTYLDKSVFTQLHILARKTGSKYQTVLNQMLRDALLGEKNGVLSRLSRLEKAVFHSS